MRHNRRIRKAIQSGFTLIELIVVIVILGILAAVAIPNFTDTADNADAAVQTATLGALKSAWSAEFAVSAPDLPLATGIRDRMLDPTCTLANNTFTCGGMDFPVTVNAQGRVASPADITQ